MRFEPFAWFMDYCVYPVFWLARPGLRQHQRDVKTQNEHLSGQVHVVPDPNCWYCNAREEDRRHR